jgi:cyclophilin family peptidyl-prolyl cis-trans isomerase/HEAT repeat protein
MRTIIFSLAMCVAVLVFVQAETFAQHATSNQVEIAILKAEDERRYDKTLADLLKSPNERFRVRAALAAGRIGDDAAVAALSTMLESDRSMKAREMAAFALGEIESLKAADVILRLIGETAKAQNPGVDEHDNRGRLAEAAGKIAAANTKDPKAKDLGQAIVFTLEAERNKSVQNTETIRLALTAALRSRPVASEEVVRKFLAHTDPAIVADALNTLARLRAKNANRDARDLLATNVHAIVRANAARVLGAAEDKESVDLLIKAATSDSDSRVRVAAIRSLAALKDAKAADPLLNRGQVVFAAYKKAWKPNIIPNEHSEFLEIATTLGRLLTNTRDERAVDLFRQFGKLDRGFSPEVYIARLRISPRRGDDDKPELTHWRQYSTVAQVVGEFATLDPTTEEGKRMKAEAPDILRPLARAYAEADPVKDADTIKAGPDVLQAYARFKTEDLGEIARKALHNKDVQIRVAAAGILADLPASGDNIEGLRNAFASALLTDKTENDAQLAIMDALFKLDKRATANVLPAALAAPDFLVRRKAVEFLNDRDAWKDRPSGEIEDLIRSAEGKDIVNPYSVRSGTKLGQVLNGDVDYRRALSRKNGSARAILMTQKGTFTIDFVPEDAPLTVDNFIKLARANYFNGLEVHRVVPNFVMQDGDPRGDGNGGPGWSIRCEINMVPYERGAVGMALSGKDTGGSQWFVTHSPQPHLDGGYTVFGHVNEPGMKVVDQIVRGDKIISVKIVESVSTQRSRSPRRGK